MTVYGGSLHNASLSPGPAANTTGTLTLQSTLSLASAVFHFDLNSDTGAADQVVANGVSLLPTLQSLFTFTDLGHSNLPLGTDFTVINNAASSPIAGMFGNLPDGSIFGAGLNFFQVDYQGGNGNDLTLTVVNHGSVPEGGTTLSLLVLALFALAVLHKSSPKRILKSS